MSTTTCSVDAIVQEITIKAPAARVFEALTDLTQRMKWWGQEGRFETTNAESDRRPLADERHGNGKNLQSRSRLSDHRTSECACVYLVAVLGRTGHRDAGAIRSS
jgi:hypothetical protein